MLSLNSSKYVIVESTIGNKKVILVFDDLERCNLNEVDALECINEYCENRKIKTIIVANEEKIKQKSLPKEDRNGKEEEKEKEKSKEGLNNKAVVSRIKINYSEIKEKIITKIVKKVPDYKKIIIHVIEKFEENEKRYKVFLQS